MITRSIRVILILALIGLSIAGLVALKNNLQDSIATSRDKWQKKIEVIPTESLTSATRVTIRKTCLFDGREWLCSTSSIE